MISVSTNFTLCNINFTAIEIGGIEFTRKRWNSFYPEANAIVFMVDAADKHRFDEVQCVISDS
jgi:GTPase SAR1 family protein